MKRLAAQAILAAACFVRAANADAADAPTKLCLYPVQVPLAQESGAARRESLEARLVAALRAASFEVADPPRVRKLRDDVAARVGDLFDPATGERIPEAYDRLRDQLAQAFREQLGCDYQLVASVVVVRATFAAGSAAWDGTRQQVVSTGRIVLGVLAGALESGWVNAFSLRLRALDFRDETVGLRSAGIETPVQFAVIKDQDLVPEDLWLSDAARLDAAIASALGTGGSALRAVLPAAPAVP